MKEKQIHPTHRVLVVATSPQTRGGITSVVAAHQTFSFWQKFQVRWITTHRDSNVIIKLIYFITGLGQFLWHLPSVSLVHIHLSEPPSAIRKMIFFQLTKIFSRKVILHFHSYDPETTINGKYKNIYHRMFSSADRVIVLSESWKRWIKEYLDIEYNIQIIYNPCIPVDNYIIPKEKTKAILYAGTINSRKGYADLIRAFQPVAFKYPDWKLVIAGNGEIEQGKELARQLGIEKNVEFPGWVKGKEKELLFSNSSIFCLPSYAEGLPVALLDACSFGLPFIATPVGGVPDIVIDGENGLLVNPGDIQGFSEKLELLINNDSLRKKLGEKAKELASTRLNGESIDKQIENLYNEILFSQGKKTDSLKFICK